SIGCSRRPHQIRLFPDGIMQLMKENPIRPAIIVHGGAWDIPDDEVADHIKGCRKATEVGYRILKGGGSALDAALAAVACMEDDPTFDAGRGAVLTKDASFEMDAGIMDGNTLEVGAIALCTKAKNPIRVAHKVLEHPDYGLLAGDSAVVKHMKDIEEVEVEGSQGARIQILLGPDDGAPNYITRCFTMDPGARIPAHRHDTIEHEQVVLEGEMAIGLGDDEALVKAGDCVFIPDGVAHWYENRGSVPVRFLCVVPNTTDYQTEWLEESEPPID
ncbi:isoaspartyl peptidase/L-asparaginase, partial [Acidobacteriota bacterium]